MDGIDKLFGAGIAVIVALNIAWWTFVAYVVYRVLTHFGIV